MRILVFGAGAIGSLVGGALSRHHAVTLVARPTPAETIRRSGLRIHGKTELHVHPDVVERATEAEAPDVVVIAVKSHDTPAALEALRPFWSSALFLSLQNGLGNVELLASSAERVLGGVTYNGVTFMGPGEVEHAGEGDTVLGPVRGAAFAEAESFAAALRECGLPATTTWDIQTALWSKAVLNAVFNPLTGLLGLKSGALIESPYLMECAEDIVDEAVAVARAQDVRLERSSILQRVRAVSLATAENLSSMLQDLERGRRTEIDAINGAIARLAGEMGLSAPVNRLLALMVKAAEERETQRGARRVRVNGVADAPSVSA